MTEATLRLPTELSALEYMHPKQLEFFRQAVEGMLIRLIARMELASDSVTKTLDGVGDEVDRAALETEAFNARASLGAQSKEIASLRRALVLMSDGRYGWCQITGDEIGLERLCVMPQATTTVHAQQRRERVQAMHACY